MNQLLAKPTGEISNVVIQTTNMNTTGGSSLNIVAFEHILYLTPNNHRDYLDLLKSFSRNRWLEITEQCYLSQQLAVVA